MNNFQGIGSGQGILKDQYPSAAYQALKKRKDAMMADADQYPLKETHELNDAHHKMMIKDRLNLKK